MKWHAVAMAGNSDKLECLLLLSDDRAIKAVNNRITSSPLFDISVTDEIAFGKVTESKFTCF